MAQGHRENTDLTEDLKAGEEHRAAPSARRAGHHEPEGVKVRPVLLSLDRKERGPPLRPERHVPAPGRQQGPLAHRTPALDAHAAALVDWLLRLAPPAHHPPPELPALQHRAVPADPARAPSASRRLRARAHAACRLRVAAGHGRSAIGKRRDGDGARVLAHCNNARR